MNQIKYQKLLEIEKEIVREVARGDKPYLRKIYRSQSTNQSAKLNERLPDSVWSMPVDKLRRS